MRRRLPKKRKSIGKSVLFMAAIIFITVIFFIIYKNSIDPNLETIARLKAETVVSQCINMGLNRLFEGSMDAEKLFFIREGNESEVVQANHIEVNRITSKLSSELQLTFSDMDESTIEVPLGALLGSKLLSQSGPDITVRVLPISVTSSDFRTEFVTEGINQTKYKIYVILRCRSKVIVPFSTTFVETENNVLIGEAVILGKVPNSYVQVPKEEILNVIDE